MIRITQNFRLRTLQPFSRTLSDKPGGGKDSDNEIKIKSIPDDDKPLQQKNEKTPSQKSRLNKLLSSMSTDSNLNIIKSVVTPRPKGKTKSEPEPLLEQESKPENVIEAVKQVAAEFKGDAKQIESELLSKLLKYSKTPDNQSGNLSDLISGMKIDRNEKIPQSKEKPHTRTDYVKRSMKRDPKEDRGDPEQRSRAPKRRPADIQLSKSSGSVNLFGEKPLGIFTNINDLRSSPDPLTTWRRLEERELKLAVTHPPANYFQKMALWTEQGKLWKFPIDNEQGLDEEAKNYFTDHIFLEKHLEGWCPSKGPIRHFMELVCVGLSKNPYYSVQQKMDHINWFQKYFDEKKELLKQVIVHEAAQQLDNSNKEQTKEL